MPRFAILQHDSPKGLHWDLLLESGTVLRTWSLPQPPQPNVEMIAEALPDHRLAYLDYEGPISEGRGSVVAWDRGTFSIERQSDTELVVVLHGGKIDGRASIVQVPGQSGRYRFSVVPST